MYKARKYTIVHIFLCALVLKVQIGAFPSSAQLVHSRLKSCVRITDPASKFLGLRQDTDSHYAVMHESFKCKGLKKGLTAGFYVCIASGPCYPECIATCVKYSSLVAKVAFELTGPRNWWLYGNHSSR